ncbi:MAG: hypothetical protein R2719_13335 [Micropruina sp.]
MAGSATWRRLPAIVDARRIVRRPITSVGADRSPLTALRHSGFLLSQVDQPRRTRDEMLVRLLEPGSA